MLNVLDFTLIASTPSSVAMAEDAASAEAWALESAVQSVSAWVIEAIGTLGCFGAGSATPTNVGTLCSTSDLFRCSTSLLGRAKTSSARNRPIEQKAKPAKKRGVKKADLETSFLLICRIFL